LILFENGSLGFGYFVPGRNGSISQQPMVTTGYTFLDVRAKIQPLVQQLGQDHMAKKTKKAKKSLDGRHRDTTGRIDKKHGNTRVKALRKTYGEHFAKGRRGDMMLKTLLAETGTESLHAYLRKHHK
jgi:hypothetical protein